MFLFFAAVAACAPPPPPAPIVVHRTLEQPLGVTLRAARGEAILRVERASDPENPAARPRSIDRGYLEVRYEGLREDGRLNFAMKQVDVGWSDDRSPVPQEIVPVHANEREVRFGDMMVEILEATTESVTYRLRRTDAHFQTQSSGSGARDAGKVRRP